VLFLLSKTIQLIGMATVGVGLYVGLTNEHGMMQELRLLLAGSSVFLAGWFLQKKGEA